MRVKVGGGLAGHNGLRSIASHLGTQDFVRVRIGVGKPPSKEQGAGHVLSKLPVPPDASCSTWPCQEAADAVELIVADSADAAMRALQRRARRACPASGQRDDGRPR